MMCTCRTLSISIGPMGLSFVSHTNNVSFLYWINSIRSHHTQRSTRGSSRELLSRFTRNPCRHLLAWSMLSFPLYQLTPEFSGDSYPQGGNNWAQVQSIYYSAHKAVAPSGPLCLAEVLINHFLAQTASYHLYSLAVDSYSVGVLSVPVEELDMRSSVSPFLLFCWPR